MTLVQSGKLGLGSLWLLGWYIYQQIATLYCFNMGVTLYAFLIALQGGDVPAAFEMGIDFCYGQISQFY